MFEIDNTEGKNVTTILNTDDVDTPENMSNEDRMDGLVNINHLNDLNSAINDICTDMTDDGFDANDVYRYIKKQVDDFDWNQY